MTYSMQMDANWFHSTDATCTITTCNYSLTALNSYDLITQLSKLKKKKNRTTKQTLKPSNPQWQANPKTDRATNQLTNHVLTYYSNNLYQPIDFHQPNNWSSPIHLLKLQWTLLSTNQSQPAPGIWLLGEEHRKHKRKYNGHVSHRKVRECVWAFHWWST